jgi:hypothetical protein
VSSAAQPPARRPFLTLTITPIDIEVDDCIVTILEVAKLKLPWEQYQASVQVKCKDVVSRVFQVDFKDKEELKQKLLTEVAKFKYALLVYGKQELKARGIVL